MKLQAALNDLSDFQEWQLNLIKAAALMIGFPFNEKYDTQAQLHEIFDCKRFESFENDKVAFTAISEIENLIQDERMSNLNDAFYLPVYNWIFHNLEICAPLAKIEQKHVLLAQDCEREMG